MLVSAAEQHKQSNFNLAKRLKFEEEKQQSDMKFSTEAKAWGGNEMNGVCFDERSS